MTYRKHILTAAFGVLLFYYVGDWLLENALQAPLEKRRTEKARLEEGIGERRRELALARQDRQQLDGWSVQSLPADAEVARSLYRAWLLKLVGEVGLSNRSVESLDPAIRKGRYQAISFPVRGRGTLRQLTEFLFKFYDAGHLHRIGSLGITPVPNTDLLDLSISIEALALFGATDEDGQPRADRLAQVRSGRLASDDLDDYQVIVQRNLFGIGGGPDALDYTYLTAVTYTEDRPTAWFTLRTSGETQKLGVGDRLEVDQFTATIAEIEGSDVILETTTGRWLLTIGDRLAEAWALPSEY